MVAYTKLNINYLHIELVFHWYIILSKVQSETIPYNIIFTMLFTAILCKVHVTISFVYHIFPISFSSTFGFLCTKNNQNIIEIDCIVILTRS